MIKESTGFNSTIIWKGLVSSEAVEVISITEDGIINDLDDVGLTSGSYAVIENSENENHVDLTLVEKSEEGKWSALGL